MQTYLKSPFHERYFYHTNLVLTCAAVMFSSEDNLGISCFVMLCSVLNMMLSLIMELHVKDRAMYSRKLQNIPV